MRHHSGTVARERLRLMMDMEKNRLDEETMWQIRTEIGSVITKYVNVDPENVEVKVLLKDYQKRG